MKKKNKGIDRRFPPVVVWQEDLEAIVETLGSRQASITVETEHAEYDGLADLIGHLPGQRISGLTIRADSRPPVTVRLAKYTTAIETDAEDDASRGVVARLEDILRPAQRPLRWQYANAGPAEALPLMNIAYFVLKPNWYVVGFAVVAWVLITARASYIALRKHSTIVLARRTQQSSFWRRNKDQLLVALFGVLIGAIVTAAVTVLVGRTT